MYVSKQLYLCNYLLFILSSDLVLFGLTNVRGSDNLNRICWRVCLLRCVYLLSNRWYYLYVSSDRHELLLPSKNVMDMLTKLIPQ